MIKFGCKSHISVIKSSFSGIVWFLSSRSLFALCSVELNRIPESDFVEWKIRCETRILRRMLGGRGSLRPKGCTPNRLESTCCESPGHSTAWPLARKSRASQQMSVVPAKTPSFKTFPKSLLPKMPARTVETS